MAAGSHQTEQCKKPFMAMPRTAHPSFPHSRSVAPTSPLIVEGDNAACKCLKAGIVWRPSWRLVTMATITSAQREVAFLVHVVAFLPSSGHEQHECEPWHVRETEEVGIYQPHRTQEDDRGDSCRAQATPCQVMGAAIPGSRHP